MFGTVRILHQLKEAISIFVVEPERYRVAELRHWGQIVSTQHISEVINNMRRVCTLPPKIQLDS